MLALLLAAVTVSTAFEGGNLGKVETVAPDHLRCAVKGQADQNGRNRQANWYYFELKNLPSGSFRFDLTDLVGEYNFKPGSHAVTKGTRPVYSYDGGRTWNHFTDDQVSWNDTAKELSVRFTPAKAVIRIAHTAPYTQIDLEVLHKELAAKPYFHQEIIGKSVHGRPIPLWTITDPQAPESGKRVIWWMVRQHAWETGTSWVLEGGLRRLAADTPDSASLRKRFIFKILPCPDPDGMAEGAVRFNANGYDINRNWDAIDPILMPEIAAQRKAVIGWVDGGHQIDLFLSMHNTESVDYIDGPLAALRPTADRFQRLLNEKTVFYAPNGPRDAGESTTPGMKGRKTVHQELFAARKIPAFLMEQMVERHPLLKRPPTVQDRLEFGAALVDVLTQTVEP
ncbi:M14-type cytosolic carboxypeptidase [uncultured Paludibaculum sp.]|uniref:M14-type cytosolic carboxypeptidase n=1 Tax=uncultured Paludibaculum sp. TaxID=1765020 RepID=UPI002AAAE7EF|nr:M14-type cytosolic carboxypeptidase [uncultured Paludibaculum sp.]